MRGKEALRLAGLTIIMTVALFTVMGCPPVDEGTQQILIKALAGNGCQGCTGCVPDEGEGEVEGETEGEHGGEGEGETENEGEVEQEGEGEGELEGESEGEVEDEGEQEGELEGEGEHEAEVEPEPGEMVTVPGGSFQMGNPDAEPWEVDQTPVHAVSLDTFAIGKYEVTNAQFAAALNWAHGRGLLRNSSNNSYNGETTVYAYGQPLVSVYKGSGTYSRITYSTGKFRVDSFEGYGGQMFSMAEHPAVTVCWYGAVAYCNWLSENQGLEPCYDTATWTRYEPVRNGYRLLTEAEWERAAAWDGTKHWTYGMTSDTTDFGRANYYENPNYANPLGLLQMPYTAPVGWYNGSNPVNLSTPGTFTTNAASPTGAYDMSGNLWEWCHDYYGSDYYASSAPTNPTGPASGTHRILRGGSYYTNAASVRTASRIPRLPAGGSSVEGFRIARTP